MPLCRAAKTKAPAGTRIDAIKLANYYDGVTVLEFWATQSDDPAGCIVAYAYVSTARLALALAGEHMKPR